MIEAKPTPTKPRPRSGLRENSPALQCWVQNGLDRPEPVKRATEVNSSVGFMRKLQSSAARTRRKQRRSPSDKSLGYFQMSAARTMPMLAFLISLLLGLPSSKVFAQESAPSPAPSPMVSAQQTLKVPTVAIDYRADANRPLTELRREGVDANEQQPMTLREAIALALTNNKDIEVARDNVKIAEYDLLSVHGAYDPRLSAQSNFERIKTPAASFLSGASNAVETENFTANSRLEGLAPKFGGNYRLDFSSARATSNSIFTALNPQYPTALTFTYTQPLVRGFRFDGPRRQIEIAKKNLSLTDAQFRQRAIETITSVQRSYWDLVFALRNLQVQREAVRDSRTQLEHNQRMVSEGALAPIDVVAAEAQVAGFEQALFSSLEEVSRSENNLKNLIAENHQSDLWNLSILPTDSVDLVTPEISLPDAMKAAMDNRPELQQSTVAREINQIDQKYFREQTKPQIDLVGTYGMVGLAGTTSGSVNPLTSSSTELGEAVNKLLLNSGFDRLPDPPVQTISPDLLGGYNQSLQNLLANRFNNYRVGVQISLPLRNRTADAQLGRSLVEGERLATQREQLQQSIQVEVRNALQLVRSAEARLHSAVIQRQASEQQ